MESGNISNRFTEARRRIVVSVAFLAQLVVAVTSHADVCEAVAEADGFELVYSLNIPNAANYGANPVPYSVDNHLSITGPVDRIAYCLEVTTPGGPTQYVYASVDAFTQDLRLIGIPTATNGAYFQRNVRNMTVTSNVPGITTGTALTGGNIEFWRSNYGTDNIAGVPNADAGAYDSGDNAGGPAGGGTYGSFQIHNHDLAARQTLFAYNRWNDGINPSDLGIGNNTQVTGDNRVNADWTFRGNAGAYTGKTLQVFVHLGLPIRAAILPLGDSITYGAGGVGGYRDQLFDDLTVAGRTFEFIGSAGGNPSAALTAASQVNHEGHSGYRIDQLANNLSGNDGTGGNNGGFWFNTGVQPDVILLHIGTNDIWQRYNPGARGNLREKTFLANLKNRLESLVNQMTTARPNAHLLVAGIIPMNVTSGGKFLNDDVKAYNSYIQNTLVPKYQNLGRNVRFVNQYQKFVNPNGSIKTALLPDGAHPNQTGYDLMADTWFTAIQALP
jgi:lysophospholipase L1-like esterase